jgi:hypothetical protein
MMQARQEGAGRNHPAEADLVRFMRGEISPTKALPIVRHLLTGCARCSEVTRKLWGFGDEASERRGLFSPCSRAGHLGVWL